MRPSSMPNKQKRLICIPYLKRVCPSSHGHHLHLMYVSERNDGRIRFIMTCVKMLRFSTLHVIFVTLNGTSFFLIFWEEVKTKMFVVTFNTTGKNEKHVHDDTDKYCKLYCLSTPQTYITSLFGPSILAY